MGTIRVYAAPAGFRARAQVRDLDGRTRSVERTGRTRGAAERRLKEAFRDRTHRAAGDLISPDTRISVLADTWFASLDQHSPTTLQLYRHRIDHQIKPALGQLRIRELTVGTVDRHLRTVAATSGPAMSKLTRSVLSGMCGLAARYDALDRNPVRDASRISRPPKKPPKALTAAQARQLRAILTYDDKAVARDLPDLVSFMLASGLRIGEVSAVTWDAVDFERGTVQVRGTVIRVKGQGLVVKATKTTAGLRTLALPRWCVEVLTLRREAFAPKAADTPVFPAPKGGLRDPSNTQADLRDSLAWAGVPWVTSHVFRKTTATLLDEAGLSARAIADQLGHAQPSLTQNVYMGRNVATTAAATALEALA
jgi:integrase